MRQGLGQFPAFLLRRLLLPPGSLFRLRRLKEKRAPRESREPLLQHVALRGVSAPAGGLHCAIGYWRHAVGGFAQAGAALGSEESFHQERRGVLPFSVL